MIKAYKGKVIVTSIEKGERKTSAGIVLGNDDGKSEGIRTRWAKVYSVGEGVIGIEPGNWIALNHGRWTRGINHEGETLYMIDYPSGVIAVSDSDECPEFTFQSQASSAKGHTFRPEEFSDVQSIGGIRY